MWTSALFVFVLFALAVFYVIAKTAVVVPQQNAYVVERLGRFAGVLDAGFHILVPFVDVIRYRHVLKEQAMDIPEQVCITKDNVQVAVDGILYLKVLDPERASYGISNYMFAITQLAQTTLRSEIGKIDLDRTFEERVHINGQVVAELDKASEAWGVKVLRYEIKNITPPQDILAAMEKQMRAEREKRAVILQSEGERDAAINTAEGQKQQVIKASEAKKQQQINEADGQAAAILAVAKATAEGIRSVAGSIQADGGFEAVQLRVAEQYIDAVRPPRQGGQQPGDPVEPVRRRLDDRGGDDGDPVARRGSGPAAGGAGALGIARALPGGVHAARACARGAAADPGRGAALAARAAVQLGEAGRDAALVPPGVVRLGTAHCLEAALAAAVVLEQHGHPPLLLSFESVDRLDHVLYVFRGQDGRWGAVARSRDLGLHGRQPVFRSAAPARRELPGRLRRLHRPGHRLRGRRPARARPLRLAAVRAQRLEGRALAGRLPAPAAAHVGCALRRLLERYRSFKARYPDGQPTYYEGREAWM